MRILFLFINGIGIAKLNPKFTPFTNARMPFLDQIIGKQAFSSNASNVKRESEHQWGCLVCCFQTTPILL